MHRGPGMTSRRRLGAAVPLLLLLACGGPYQPGIGPGVRPNPGSGSGSGGGGGGGGISVRGRVLDGTRQPIPSRTVLIGAQSAVTDATGNFSLDHVTAPYDLTVITIGQENAATIYQGLTRVDPKVLDFASPGSLSNHAHVTGNLLGGDPCRAPRAPPPPSPGVRRRPSAATTSPRILTTFRSAGRERTPSSERFTRSSGRSMPAAFPPPTKVRG
jgi:hypothetical protein